MMKFMTVTNHLGESLTLDLANPELSGFAIVNIDGLGPVKADISITNLSTADGGLYNSSRVGVRNIVIDIKYLWKPTIEDSRQLSYKYFPTKKEVTLTFDTDNRSCEIVGLVESNSPNIFSSESGAQISILCPDPYFYSLNDVSTVFSGVQAMFELPFSNESLTEKLIEFGSIQSNQVTNILYEGDAYTGVDVYLHAFGPVENPMVYNTVTQEFIKIDTAKLQTLTGSGIIAGDDIHISTIRGKKQMKLTRSGVVTNILNCLDEDSSWFGLEKGDNLYSYTASSGETNLEIRFDNRVRYEGV